MDLRVDHIRSNYIKNFEGHPRVFLIKKFTLVLKSTSHWYSTHVHHWTEGDIDTFAFELAAHEETAATDEITIPPGCNLYQTKHRQLNATYVMAVLMPAGKAVVKSTSLTPSGES